MSSTRSRTIATLAFMLPIVQGLPKLVKPADEKPGRRRGQGGAGGLPIN